MIDRLAFAKVMGGFADKIGRALAPETSEMYYDVLTHQLSTEQFLAGARIVFRQHGYNTWPAPQAFIDAVCPPDAPRLEASDAFDRLVGRDNPDRLALSMGPVVMRAFRAAGGRREFVNVLEQDVKWLRKAFIEAYESAHDTHRREGEAFVALDAVDPNAKALIDHLAGVRDMANAKRLPADYKAIASGDA